jgi:multidrug efflux system membrane fusion protein
VKRYLPTLVLVLLVLAALAFTYKNKIFPKTADEQAESAGGPGRGMGRRGRRARNGDPNRAVPILAEAAKTASVPVYLHGVGTVHAYNTATVRPQVSGRLTAVNYVEGQDVKKGDVLARIDPVTYKATYDQALARKAMNEALLANARRDLARYEGLAKADYASRQQADTQRATVAQLEAQLRQDQAAIDSAKANLDYTTIVAPIGGRTGIREVDAGNLVTPNDASGIAVITQLKPVSVLFTLPETTLGELIAAKERGAVALTASVGGRAVAEGALEVIDNRIDQTTGTVKLKGTFANERLSLWPGQFVNVRLHLKTLEGATVVSSAAVQQGAEGRFVYVLQPDGTVKLTPVTVTQEDEHQAVIASGIAPGDRIATAGFSNLQDGQKISLGDGARPAAGQNGVDQRQKDGRKRRSDGSQGGQEQSRNGQGAGEANASERRTRRSGKASDGAGGPQAQGAQRQ